MNAFSWTDSFYAMLHTCLPCIVSTAPARHDNSALEGHDSGSRTSRASRIRTQQHYDELDGLLADTDHSDADAETLSLHSNINATSAPSSRSRRRRRERRKRIAFCGFNLFGAPAGHHSNSDEETDSDGGQLRRAAHGERSRLSIGRLGPAHASSASTSSYVFDSDASSLDPAVITQLAARDAEEAALRAVEEDQRCSAERKEEEKRQRAHTQHDQTEVDNYEYGPFVTVLESHQTQYIQNIHGDAEESVISPRSEAGNNDHDSNDEADFGGESYVRKSSRRAGGSDSTRSHSTTSATRPDSHKSIYDQSPSKTHITPRPGNPLAFPGKGRSSSRKSLSSGTQSTAGTTNLSTSPVSQNSSLRTLAGSPISDPYVSSLHLVSNAPSVGVSSLSSRQIEAPFEFEGTPLSQDSIQKAPSASEIESRENRFPSVGFSGIRRESGAGTNGISGVFLSRLGDD